MVMLTNDFLLIAVALLAFVAGAALRHRRFRCPACGWGRREGVPGAFKYHEVVLVSPTQQGFWAVRVLGREPILLCSRTSALEYAIQSLVDAVYQDRSQIGKK